MRVLTGLRLQHPLEGYPRFPILLLLLLLLPHSTISSQPSTPQSDTLRHATTRLNIQPSNLPSLTLRSLMLKRSVSSESSVVETPSRPYSPLRDQGDQACDKFARFGVPAPVRRSFRAKADQPVETCIAPEFRLTKFNQIAADSTKCSLWDVQV